VLAEVVLERGRRSDGVEVAAGHGDGPGRAALRVLGLELEPDQLRRADLAAVSRLLEDAEVDAVLAGRVGHLAVGGEALDLHPVDHLAPRRAGGGHDLQPGLPLLQVVDDPLVVLGRPPLLLLRVEAGVLRLLALVVVGHVVALRMLELTCHRTLLPSWRRACRSTATDREAARPAADTPPQGAAARMH
jgi:hypothetical protein